MYFICSKETVQFHQNSEIQFQILNVKKILSPGFQARPQPEAAPGQPAVAVLHRHRPGRQDQGPVLHPT